MKAGEALDVISIEIPKSERALTLKLLLPTLKLQDWKLIILGCTLWIVSIPQRRSILHCFLQLALVRHFQWHHNSMACFPFALHFIDEKSKAYLVTVWFFFYCINSYQNSTYGGIALQITLKTSVHCNIVKLLFLFLLGFLECNKKSAILSFVIKLL